MRYIIRQERDGSKGISRYFKKRSLARSEYFSDTEFAPAKDANVRRLSGLEDLSESAREYLGEYFDGDTVQGVTAMHWMFTAKSKIIPAEKPVSLQACN